MGTRFSEEDECEDEDEEDEDEDEDEEEEEEDDEELLFIGGLSSRAWLLEPLVFFGGLRGERKRKSKSVME